MAKYKVIYDRAGCIGAAACVGMDGKYWEMNSDGKADLKGSTEENGMHVKIIDEADYSAAKDAADACPVAVIKVIKLEEEK